MMCVLPMNHFQLSERFIVSHITVLTHITLVLSQKMDLTLIYWMLSFIGCFSLFLGILVYSHGSQDFSVTFQKIQVYYCY